MGATKSSETRLRAVLEAGMAITSELSLETLLLRVVESAAALTGARYAALGVIDRTGSQLERFVTTGVEDQEIVSLLASQAAVAIENARLYEATTQWSSQLESLNEIGNALATETELERLLELIARRLRELLEARLVTVLLPAGEADLRF